MSRSFPVSMSHGQPQTYGSAEAVLVHAAEHARNRLLHACEAISWVGGLALRHSTGTRQFSITGAQIQDATAGSGEEAAHVLVGQLLIDGKPPWAFVRNESEKVAWLARFMVTSAVPAPFNVADSAAERAGLKEAFRQACETAWRNTAASKGTRSLTSVYALFLEAADQAFQRAELGKQSKQVAAATKNAAASDERFVESLILRAYRLHSVTAAAANQLFPLPQS
jgi:hypothetical protein